MATLLISDTNILMDVQAGGLEGSLFSLPYTFAVPDILFEEELAADYGHMVGLGLQVMPLSAQIVETAVGLAMKYRGPSSNDRLALALALATQAPLLTGDQALRRAAESEQVRCMGTIWLITEMIKDGRISKPVALAALERMKAARRRLPWAQAERAISET